MKKTRKLLAILLALITCLGIFSMAASAAIISSITIYEVKRPVVGEKANYEYVISNYVDYEKSPDSYGYSGYWVETSTKPTSWSDVAAGTAIYGGNFNFKSDKYYTFVARLKAKSGHTFSSTISAIINHRKAGVWIDGAERHIWYCLGKAASYYINEAHIYDVETPVVGSPLSFEKSSAYGVNFYISCDPYGHYGYWSETDTKPNNIMNVDRGKKVFESDGEYIAKPGKYYTFVIIVVPYEDYTFADPLNATISGKSAEVNDVSNPNSLLAESKHIWYCFGKTGELSGIEISSLPKQTELQYKSYASIEGLCVEAIYSDGGKVNISDKVNVDKFDKVNVKNFDADQKPGEYTATVEYEGKTAEFPYTVKYTWWQWIIQILLLGFLWY